MGLGHTRDSAFAEVLLHSTHNGTRDSGEIVSNEDICNESSNFCSPLYTDKNPDLSFGHRHLYNCISSATPSEKKIFTPKNHREEFSTI